MGRRTHRRYYKKVIQQEPEGKSLGIEKKAGLIKTPVVIFKIADILRNSYAKVREKLITLQ